MILNKYDVLKLTNVTVHEFRVPRDFILWHSDTYTIKDMNDNIITKFDTAKPLLYGAPGGCILVETTHKAIKLEKITDE